MTRLSKLARLINCLSFTFLLLLAKLPLAVPVPWAAGAIPPSQSVAAQDERPRFALLVGINDYQSKEITKLRGAVNDVVGMKELLVSRYRFPDNAEHIRVLTDRSATKENILGLFDSFLIKNAEKYRDKSPIIIFHYSGHGSRVEDFGGDEPDGKDETIVPADSGVNGKVDIIDDEIEERVRRLAELTDNALYVFDSCYSGTVNRGDNLAREAPEDKARYPQRNKRTDARRAPQRVERERIGFLPASNRYVVISGARSNQKAYERPLPGNQYYGAMTYFLLQELRVARSETSYQELMTRVSNAVRRENEDQSPQVQGDITRAVLGGAASQKDHFIRISKVENNKQLVIGAGATLSVRQGAIVAVYKSGTQHLTGQEGRLALAEVKSVGPVTSVAEITELSPNALVSVNDEAVLLTPFYGSDPMSVVLETDGGTLTKTPERKTLNEVAAMLRDNPLVNVSQISTSESDCRGDGGAGRTALPAADVYVRHEKFECAFPVPPLSKQITEDGGEIPRPKADERIFYLAAKGGEPVYEFWVRANDANAPQSISDALLKMARQRNLLALENRTSPLNGSIEVTVLRVTLRTEAGELEVETETPVTLKRGDGGDIYYSFRLGDIYRLQLRNKSPSGGGLYVSALNVSNDGAINMMYPPVAGELEPLRSGNAVKTNVFEITAPLGEENFKIIVTTTPADFGPLLQGRAAAQQRGENNPLNVLMRQVLTGTRGSLEGTTRGIDEWGTSSVIFVIRE